METMDSSSLKGQFLIAMPHMKDSNFLQTVICLCEHTPQGAVGIVINRVHPQLTGKTVFDEVRMEYSPQSASVPIYIGGPVRMGEIFILHRKPFKWKGCLMVTSTLAMSNTLDILSEIAQGRGPASYLISLGCAGWGPGQLDAEIQDNVWLTSSIWEDVIFDVKTDQRWNAALKKLGVNPLLLSSVAGHA